MGGLRGWAPPLNPAPGTHKIRFAVTARRNTPAVGAGLDPEVRAVSNPVEIQVWEDTFSPDATAAGWRCESRAGIGSVPSLSEAPPPPLGGRRSTELPSAGLFRRDARTPRRGVPAMRRKNFV